MGSITGRRLVVGLALAVAIAGASGSAVLFSGGGSGELSVSAGTSGQSALAGGGRQTSTTTSTSTSTTSTSTTTSTTTTAPPPPAPEPAPEPPPVEPAPAPEPVVLAPPPAPVSFCSGGAGGTAGAVLAAMNADRGGLGALCWNAGLGASAQGWASTMASKQLLFHSDIGVLLATTSFSTVGENVLVGPADLSAGAMEAAWMDSPSHRANILGNYSAAGVGVAQGGDGQVYVAVHFGG